MPLNRAQSITMELFGSNDLDPMLSGKVEVAFSIDLPTQSDLKGETVGNQSFFHCVLHRCAMRVRAPEVSAPGIPVRIELHKGYWPKLLMDRPKNRQQNRMIPAYANRLRSALQDSR